MRQFGTRRFNGWIGAFLFLLTLLLFPMSGNAQTGPAATCSTPANTGVGADFSGDKTVAIITPPTTDEPTKVQVTLDIEWIDTISDITDSFRLHGRLKLSWCDPRVPYKETGDGVRNVYVDNQATAVLREIWIPDVIFGNGTAARTILDFAVTVDQDHKVEYTESFTTILKTSIDSSRYPFDDQVLNIRIKSFSYDLSQVELVPLLRSTPIDTDLIVPSWRIDSIGELEPSVFTENTGTDFAVLVAGVEISRVSGPLYIRMLLPQMLVTLASFSVFWMRSASTGRHAITFTAILTNIAFSNITMRQHPEVPELTFPELVSLFSLAVLFCVVITNTVVEYLTGRNRDDLVVRVDRYAPLIFIPVYILGILALKMQIDAFGLW